MGYCTLEEAWGENYVSEENNYVINNIEPMTNITPPPTTYGNVAQGIEANKNLVPVMMNQNKIPVHLENNNNVINQSQIQQQQQQLNVSQPKEINQNNVNNDSKMEYLYKMINDLRKENYELKLQIKNKLNINFDNLPEIFLYGIIIFLILDVFFGFRK